MAITLNTLAYSQDSFVSPNKVLYVGPSNTFAVKDQLTLGRTAPRATKENAGWSKAEAVRTKTVTLADGSKADAIVKVNCSLPVGMAKADADSLRDDVGDLAIAAYGENLFWKATIAQ